MMRLNSSLRVFVLSVILVSLMAPAPFGQVVSSTQASDVALQRGYRTGYSDGYMAGYRDTIDGVAASHIRHAEYARADRAFSKDYGEKDDYRDGYQQGFESGYQTGYERKSFESSLPQSLKKRGVIDLKAPTQDPGLIAQHSDNDQSAIKITQQSDPVKPLPQPAYLGATIIIPRDIELILELQDDLNTEQSREGEKFIARVVSPSEIAGATVEGRVAKVLKPGRIKRRSELQLSFDRIILSDQRWSNFSGTLVEVLAVKGDNVKRVDNEGTAVGQSSIKDDVIKVSGTTGAGALVGGLVGGPVGIAVGAGVGAAFGVGAVVIERGKHIRLTRNQQLRIRTAYDTQIR